MLNEIMKMFELKWRWRQLLKKKLKNNSRKCVVGKKNECFEKSMQMFMEARGQVKDGVNRDELRDALKKIETERD